MSRNAFAHLSLHWWRARIGQVRCAGREGAQKKGGPEGPPKDDLTSGGINQNFFDTVTP
jgi:hypothetical protein